MAHNQTVSLVVNDRYVLQHLLALISLTAYELDLDSAYLNLNAVQLPV